MAVLIGKVVAIPKGEWNAATSYDKYNIAYYTDGHTYIALEANNNIIPPDNPDKWVKLVDNTASLNAASAANTAAESANTAAAGANAVKTEIEQALEDGDFVGPAGPKGDDGQSPTITIGTVTKGDTAAATLTGTYPNYVLNLTLPKGDTGATGADGQSPTLAIGTVQTGSAGSDASASMSGNYPNYELNLTIPRGENGADGVDGANGISPTVEVSKSGKVTTITITDAEGTHTATVNDGADGSGAGDMLVATYDTNGNGIVDDAEKLGGQAPSYYAKASDIPNVPSWAMASSKPTYTATEVGAAAAEHTHEQSDITGLTAALSGKAAVEHTHEQADINGLSTALAGKVNTESGKGLSTNDYTTAEKQKLAGIAEGANNYTHPATHPASMITGLSTVATSGSYNDLADKPNIAEEINVDDAITETSQNPVTSAAIFEALAGKAELGIGKIFNGFAATGLINSSCTTQDFMSAMQAYSEVTIYFDSMGSDSIMITDLPGNSTCGIVHLARGQQDYEVSGWLMYVNRGVLDPTGFYVLLTSIVGWNTVPSWKKVALIDDIQSGFLQSVFNDTITLSSTGWTRGDDSWYSQTVTATGVTATAIVYVAFHPDSRSAFLDAGIYCSAQEANQLTFKAASQPESNISVNVHAMEVSA